MVRLLRIKALVLAVPFVLMGCQDGNKQAVSEETNTAVVADTIVSTDTLYSEVQLKHEAEVVKDRVEGIFRIVKANELNGCLSRGEILDRSYCSESWNRLLLAVHNKEEQSCTAFFDIDYWTMVREPGVVSFDEFVVTSLTIGEEMRATVAYTVYGLETYTPAQVDLVFEKGKWVIDNFHNLRYMLDVRSSMKKFLASTMS